MEAHNPQQIDGVHFGVDQLAPPLHMVYTD